MDYCILTTIDARSETIYEVLSELKSMGIPIQSSVGIWRKNGFNPLNTIRWINTKPTGMDLFRASVARHGIAIRVYNKEDYFLIRMKYSEDIFL